jgi:hypothetical protein
VVAVIPVTAAIARTVDAGLLSSGRVAREYRFAARNMGGMVTA